MQKRHWSKRIDRGIHTLQRLFSGRGWRRFVGVILMGWLMTLSLHIAIAVAVQSNGNGVNVETIEQAARSPSAQVQQAENYYQAEQLSEAIALWRQAVTQYEQDGDSLNRSLVLSFLATAYADLGDWTQANSAMTQAISLFNTQSPASSDTSQVFAQVLTAQGRLQLAQGQASDALATWQQAESVYRETNNINGVLGSQINQARALQAEGFYRRATDLLTQVEQSLQNQPDSRLKVTGLRSLGKMLRLVGNLAQSRTVLEQSLAIAQNLGDAVPRSDISSILLSLGNTTRAQGELETALDFYQQAIATAPSLTTKTQIQLAQLSLLVDTERQIEAQQLFTQIQSQLDQLPLSRLAAYARIDLAQSAVKISRHQTEAESASLLRSAAEELATAIQQLRSIGAPERLSPAARRGESYALGTLGSLYETTQQWDNAKTLTQQALSLAQSIDAADIAYQWQWQLGRIFCQGQQPCPSTEDRHNATVAYAEAVKSLRSLRSDLAAINQDLQFSFLEKVEPVYRQYVELLLQSETNAPSQENLIQARETIEALQLAELDNFFREACITARPVKIDQIDPHAAVVYPIILPNQFAVILSLPNQPLRYYTTSLPQGEVEQILTQMLQGLRATAFVEDLLPSAQQIYDLLIRPQEAELAANDIKTLVFVPDGLLRSLPMAVLHDGQQYLIEKYSLALTPGLQLLQPQAIDRLQLQGLLAGLSQPRENFSALPNVVTEISQIEAEIPSQVLLDQSFTNQALTTGVDSTPSQLIHLATHGQFSSNADDTFILTWDGRINVKQLDQLLRFREGELSPIELLVLSACQTATGDRRAALGMAGVAVRSGARSTIASLWSVNDLSTASLMIEFYHELGRPGITRAEALRRAQLTLLHQDGGYTSPYYWAPFVLLGNWL